MANEHEMHHENHASHGPGYASPEEAMKAEPEKVLYTIALYEGTGIEEPDYLATGC
jgi:methanethiol oxidase